MHHTIIRRTVNTKGKVDATKVFIPESDALKDLLVARGDLVNMMDLESISARNLCQSYNQTNTLSVFCHGWPAAVEALPRGRTGAVRVARWMQKGGCEQFNMFACNSARERPEGCFAQWVAEECHELGHVCQIYGHECRGHATWNPKIRFYWSTNQGITTETLFDPNQDPWSERAAFRKRLKKEQKYRLLLPFIFDEDEE